LSCFGQLRSKIAELGRIFTSESLTAFFATIRISTEFLIGAGKRIVISAGGFVSSHLLPDGSQTVDFRYLAVAEQTGWVNQLCPPTKPAGVFALGICQGAGYRPPRTARASRR
jgi:hypothetical protein